MRANELAELVKQKIENLRPKLLDLSRRNPLIATKLGPRSNSHIRVVDELPDILFYKLNNGQELPLVPLPAIDEDPRDERTTAFRDALINARLTDEQYLAEMESVDRDADDYIDRTRLIERGLKDRVRVRYLTGDQKTLQVTISRTKSDPAQGIVYYETPVAKALLGAEEGDEVEVLVGSYVRPAIVERIIRPVTHPI